MRCACANFSSVACPALQYFSKSSHKRQYFPPSPPKKKCYWKCNVCFDFLYKFCLTYSYYNKKWARYNQKYALVLMCSTRYSCLILMKPDFSRQIFQNDSNINFHEDSSIRSHGVPCGEKDRRADGETDNHDACKGRSSQFYESV